MEEGRSAFKTLMGKPPGNRTLGRPRCKWEDNIRIGRKEIGVDSSNSVDSTRDCWRALVNAALNLRVP